MRKMQKEKISLCLGVLCLLAAVFPLSAKTAAKTVIPLLSSPVMDEAHIILDAKERELAAYLNAVSEQTGVQIAVLTVQTLAGEALESYSMRAAEAWQLGDAQKDTGVLLLVAVQEHRLRIETGYGLEGVLTDAKCGMIIRNSITPHFKAGNYTQGIVNGVMQIADIATGGAKIDTALRTSSGADEYSAFTDIASVIFCLLVVFFMLTRRAGFFPFGLFWLFPHGASRRPPYHGGFGPSSGFSGGRGSSGSHFSGGGGHFGGGGASGRW